MTPRVSGTRAAVRLGSCVVLASTVSVVVMMNGVSGARRSSPITAAATTAVRPTGPLVPASGALLGAFVSTTGTGWAPQDVTTRETELGRRFDIDHRYQNWTTAFPTPADFWDAQQGRIAMVTWQPNTATLDAINAGTYDDLIRARAHDVAAFGQPMFLRWAHEMNADWYPWGGPNNNSGNKHDGPAKYVAAWRRIHDLFAAGGATNAVWVWCPNRTSFPNRDWNTVSAYYPGDAYVDWVCFDGYDRDASHWTSFAVLFQKVYPQYATRKPIMIGETSSVEGSNARAKANWIRNARSVIKTTFPSIAALVWFDTAKNGLDFRINSSAPSAAAFRDLGLDPYFHTRP